MRTRYIKHCTVRCQYPTPDKASPPPGLDALDDAPDGVLLAQQAQARGNVLIDRLARHQRQRLPCHRQHLPPEEAARLQLEQAVHHLVERGGDACKQGGNWHAGKAEPAGKR